MLASEVEKDFSGTFHIGFLVQNVDLPCLQKLQLPTSEWIAMGFKNSECHASECGSSQAPLLGEQQYERAPVRHLGVRTRPRLVLLRVRVVQ